MLLFATKIFYILKKSFMDSGNLIFTYKDKKQNKIQEDWEF